MYASNRRLLRLHEIKPAFERFFLLSMENPQLGWGFRKAFSFKPVIKTPFDLLKHLAVWQLQKFNKKSKGGPNGGRKEFSAHPMEL
ncbi:hypothetical protein JYY64_003742 [Salmonella enterica subsp. houtenae serovar 50:g,z51:-]|nr:hypothetical protein [Salmonella enterica subsp. houtenae serovar 50:g,z51:-]